jgi:hypothetical protein
MISDAAGVRRNGQSLSAIQAMLHNGKTVAGSGVVMYDRRATPPVPARRTRPSERYACKRWGIRRFAKGQNPVSWGDLI